MKGWEQIKLGDICNTQNGYAFKSSQYSEDGHFVIRIGNVQAGYIDLNNPRYINISEEKQKKFILSDGDILISLTGNVGRVGIIKNDHLPAVLNQRVARIAIKRPNICYKPFLFYYINNPLFVESLQKKGRGAAQQNISTKDVEEVLIPIPPLPEQQRIVAILDQAFAAIDQAKANAEKNLQNARELFESYLKSVFEGKSWEKKVLREVANEFGRGKSKHRPRNWEGLYGGNYPFIQTGDVRNSDKFITEYSQTYNEVGLAQSKLWKKGTICITIAANIAETAILDFDACIPDSIIGFEVDHMKVDLNFAYYLLQYYKSELKGLGKGAAQDNINLGTFENQYFPFPPLPEQKRLVKLLDLLLNETKRFEILYKMKIGNLEELRKSILQKAFAGELKTKSVPVS